jgi:hypothetical protein
VLGPTSVLFVHETSWVLLERSRGMVRSSGQLPAGVPKFSPQSGICIEGEDFWVGVEDGRDGGVSLSGRGEVRKERRDRPPSCLPQAIRSQYGGRWSRNQQMQGSPRVPESCLHNDRRSSSKSNWCKTFAGQTPTGRLIGLSHEEVNLEKQQFRLKGGSENNRNTSVFPSVQNVEAGSNDVLFFVTETTFSSTTVLQPAPGSFAQPQVKERTDQKEVIVATTLDGKILWRISPQTSSHLYDTSVAVASHPASSSQNLYLYRPGNLMAVSQTSGQALFRSNP